jgi:hypothetical protein
MAPDDSIAARTLVPSEPEVTAKPSEVTFAKVPSPERRQLQPSVPTQAKAETDDMSNPESSKTNTNPSLLQADIGSAEEHETTSSRNAKVSTSRPGGAQRRETNHNSHQRFNHTNPALAAKESSAGREPVRSTPPTREFIARGPNPRDERKTDLSAFFQPWWYAEPARERRRNPG